MEVLRRAFEESSAKPFAIGPSREEALKFSMDSKKLANFFISGIKSLDLRLCLLKIKRYKIK